MFRPTTKLLNPGDNRRGSACVELAIVAPFLFLFIFAIIEFGRLLMAVHGMETAAREGCRQAILEEATPDSVKKAVAERLAAFGISNYSLTLEPASPGDAEQWAPVTVRLTTTYNDVSWLPSPKYLKDKPLHASCTLPREASND